MQIGTVASSFDRVPDEGELVETSLATRHRLEADSGRGWPSRCIESGLAQTAGETDGVDGHSAAGLDRERLPADPADHVQMGAGALPGERRLARGAPLGRHHRDPGGEAEGSERDDAFGEHGVLTRIRRARRCRPRERREEAP